ncbi:MAG: DUF3488 domain-containing transglutaminase family protein [Gammaproteobacteria bacterium]|nr:DUF3488 domain-containing transglutaminase family protein [Gammaproteobacteria bacterium]
MKDSQQIELSRRELLTLVGLVTLAVGPLLLEIEPWIGGFFITMVVLRTAALTRPQLLLGRFLLFLLTAAGLTNVITHYPLLFGRHAGVALLVSMLGLKLMELRKRRDSYLTVLLGFFILSTQFLFSQAVWLTVYVAIITVALTGVLLESSRARPSNRTFSTFGRSLALLTQGIPVMLVLFILFPRFSSPLWHLDLGQGSGVTGISDILTPGSISSLSRSQEVAFRVTFDKQPPPSKHRYWRGPVLWETDGHHWITGQPLTETPARYQALGNPIHYEVTLEATRQKWLFALDLPERVPENAEILPDFQIINLEKSNKRRRYPMQSRLDYNTGPISKIERRKGLQLPGNITPRMRALVAEWRQSGNDDPGLVAEGLRWFRQQPYFYTLYPPLVMDNPADQFLFETRRGFCEHYATSFALLMRTAGIPSRVVIGYQGGEANPLGDYMVVRQSDAHAWVEVALPNQGWVRVDPTAAVAPERIERPFDLDLIDFGFSPGDPIRFSLGDPGFLRQFSKQLQWGMETLNASWHRWVIGYSRDRQGYLMELMGLDFLKGRRLALVAVGITALVVLLLALPLLRRGELKERDPVQCSWTRLCKKMGRKGFPRRPEEGPGDYSKRILLKHPEWKSSLEPIVRLYIGIRYGRQDNRQNRRDLKRRVRQFRP